MQQKKHFFYLTIALLAHFLVHSQTIDSLKNIDNKKLKEKKYYCSIGSGLIKYYNGNFYNYVLNDPTQELPITNTSYYSKYKLIDGSKTDGVINFKKPFAFVNIGFGIEMNKRKEKRIKIKNILEANFTTFSGNYEYILGYTIEEISSPPTGAEIIDIQKIKCNNFIYSFGYKFQPTYKNYFVSFGIFASFEHYTYSKQTIEEMHHYFYNEQPYEKVYSYISKSEINSIGKKDYFDGLLQIGCGKYIEIKKITLKPSFNFMPDILNGASIYNLSLGIFFN